MTHHTWPVCFLGTGGLIETRFPARSGCSENPAKPGPKCLDDYRRQLVNGSGSLAESPASSGFLGFSFDHFRWQIQKADESPMCTKVIHVVNPIKTYIYIYITYNTHLMVGVFDDEEMFFCFVDHLVTRFCFASRSGRSLEISHGRRMLGPSWSRGGKARSWASWGSWVQKIGDFHGFSMIFHRNLAGF